MILKKSLLAIVFADECTRTGGKSMNYFLEGKVGHLKMSHLLHFQEKFENVKQL